MTIGVHIQMHARNYLAGRNMAGGGALTNQPPPTSDIVLYLARSAQFTSLGLHPYV